MEVFNDNNKDKEKELAINGYVILDLLSDEDIDALINYFYNHKSLEYKKAYTTFSINDENYKREVDQFIKDVIDKKTHKIFNSQLESFWGNYMLKVPSENSNMPLHSDWQYVDESKFISLNLWCPLVDTSINNGALHVVPKSHKVIDFPRGVGLPRYYEQNEEIVKQKYGKLLKLKRGQAVIYDHRLLHYSLPNYSKKDRLAITLIYVPKEVDKYVFYSKNNHTNRYVIEGVNPLLTTNYFEEISEFKSKEEIAIPKYDSVNVFKNLEALYRFSIVKWIYSKFS